MEPGDVLDDKFQIVEVIGAGGMGEIVLATHLELKIRVALKIPHRTLVGNEVMQGRFLREARAAATLSNPHVCRIFDVSRSPETGVPYIVMEYLRGTNLQSLFKEKGVFSIATTCDYLLQTCEGLAEAHAHGIIHRDLKPGNIFLTESSDKTPLIKVLDFGISRSYVDEGGPRLTSAGTVLGSPQYMSPEQIESPSTVDARSDVWSLGVMIHVLASGAFPFETATYPEVIGAIVTGEIVIDRRLPAQLRPIVERCLAADREQRYRDVFELATALGPLAPDSTARIARIGRILGASVLADVTLDRPVASSPSEPSTAPTVPGKNLHSAPTHEIAIAAVETGEVVGEIERRNAQHFTTPNTAHERASGESPPRKRPAIVVAITATVIVLCVVAATMLATKNDTRAPAAATETKPPIAPAPARLDIVPSPAPSEPPPPPTEAAVVATPDGSAAPVKPQRSTKIKPSAKQGSAKAQIDEYSTRH